MGKQMFMMKSKVVGRSSIVSDDLVQSVNQNICERQRFTISELPCKFPQTSHTVLYKTATVRPGYHKFCAGRVTKMLTRAHKMQTMASALAVIFRAIPQRWR
jgi:hypothetical protein